MSFRAKFLSGMVTSAILITPTIAQAQPLAVDVNTVHAENTASAEKENTAVDSAAEQEILGDSFSNPYSIKVGDKLIAANFHRSDFPVCFYDVLCKQQYQTFTVRSVEETKSGIRIRLGGFAGYKGHNLYNEAGQVVALNGGSNNGKTYAYLGNAEEVVDINAEATPAPHISGKKVISFDALGLLSSFANKDNLGMLSSRMGIGSVSQFGSSDSLAGSSDFSGNLGGGSSHSSAKQENLNTNNSAALTLTPESKTAKLTKAEVQVNDDVQAEGSFRQGSSNFLQGSSKLTESTGIILDELGSSNTPSILGSSVKALAGASDLISEGSSSRSGSSTGGTSARSTIYVGEVDPLEETYATNNPNGWENSAENNQYIESVRWVPNSNTFVVQPTKSLTDLVSRDALSSLPAIGSSVLGINLSSTSLISKDIDKNVLLEEAKALGLPETKSLEQQLQCHTAGAFIRKDNWKLELGRPATSTLGEQIAAMCNPAYEGVEEDPNL